MGPHDLVHTWMWPWRREEPPVRPRSVLDHRDLGYCCDDGDSWQGPFPNGARRLRVGQVPPE
jgi:hypothetical protein